MRLLRIEAWPVEFRLAEPYEIAYERVEAVTNVFVRLVTDGPLVGHGCAAPDEAVTGETPSCALRALEEAEDRLRGADPVRTVRCLERLRTPLAGSPSARAAVDLALHDLLGKSTGLPLWKLLGGYRDGMPTSVTIGILPPEESVARSRDRVEQGFRCLKLKGGQDVEGDVERVLRVREAVGDRVSIRFDANQGYTVEDCLRFLEGTRSARLELLEQPTPRDQLELLGRVRSSSSLPVMADESLMGLRDAFRLARRGLVDMVNVKLMKVGGLADAVAITALARAADLDVMLGCADEAGLAIAGGLACALARPGVTHADLDGHLDLVDDPTAAAVRLRGGTLYPAERPGLGVELVG